MASTSNNSPSRRICKYDVFLSFRGPDTRNTIIDHLYNHLIKKGISVYKDDRSLRIGEFISEQLLQAIQDSRLSIIVFSRTYAASSWCLDEMAAIAECRSKLYQTVIPVFYDVDPSYVRKRFEKFDYEDYGEHTRKNFKYDPERVNRWSKAIKEFGNVAGFDVRYKAEGFSNMRSLVLLILYHNNFSGNLSSPSDNLRYLLWHGYPFTSLPSNFEPRYIVELNIPDSSIQQLWEGSKNLPNLKRMDLSNSKYFMETPIFSRTPKLERLDFTGCTNLVKVHPSIGHLTELVFLSLKNCSSLINLDFGSVSNLSSLRVLLLSGCIKLEKTPDFIRASNLEYLDMDGCTSLSTVHESIGALAKLRFLSLMDCTNLVGLPNSINTMLFLENLDLSGCSKLTTLPHPKHSSYQSRYLSSLICIDASFCNLLQVPDTIGQLHYLERLNLKGNNFDSLPSSIGELGSLAYLNLAHCHKLQTFPQLTMILEMQFCYNTASGSRDRRSGALYIFDCPKIKFTIEQCSQYFGCNDSQWLQRLLKVNNHAASSRLLSSPLPHPFYLSIEGEETEERFDMPLSLELDKIDGSKHLWIIYISRDHCHFVKTGAHITFKACPGVIIKKWGLRMLINKNPIRNPRFSNFIDFEESDLMFDYVEESISRPGPKIQLPYNWLVTEEEEVKNSEAKSKETDLFNLGL